MGLTINCKLSVAFRRDQQTNSFVGFCPALKIYSQGVDLKKCQIALEDAIRMFFKYCCAQGVVGEALKERGLIETDSAPTAEEVIAIREYDSFAELEVPFSRYQGALQCQP